MPRHKLLELKLVPDGVHDGVLEHDVDAEVVRSPVGSVLRVIKLFLFHLGEGQPPALEQMLQISVRLLFYDGGIRGGLYSGVR